MKHLLWITFLLFAFALSCKKDEKTTTATVTTNAVSNITSSSAQSGGDITSNGGSVISKNGVCFAAHNSPSISDSITTDGPTGSGSYSSTMTNLSANSTYYVRAYAINGSGTAYGSVDSFTTLPGLATITTTTISNNQELKATSGGNITNDGGSPVTARGLCWSTSPHPTTGSIKTSDSSGKGSFVDSLTNLSLTTYYVRAYATNSFGTAYGNEISFIVSTTGTVTDIDGNVYPTVVIGTQTWMGSNLKVAHYQNGDAVVNGLTSNFDWFGNFVNGVNTGAYTFPNADSTTNSKYGKYYNNDAVNDSRGICPAGWHVPTQVDWQALEYFEGMSASDTGALATRGTIAPNLLTGGSSGLDLQLAGELFFPAAGAANYILVEIAGTYWTSSFDTGINNGIPVYTNYFRQFVVGNTGIYNEANNEYGASIRCLKN